MAFGAWLLLNVIRVVNVVQHQTETNGIARFPCDSTAFFLLFIPKNSENWKSVVSVSKVHNDVLNNEDGAECRHGMWPSIQF